MKKILSMFLVLGVSLSFAGEKTTIRWSVIFKGTEPVPMAQGQKSQAWCDAHTPTAFITTPAQIKGKGVNTINGLHIRYKDYKEYNHGEKSLSFSTAYSVISGESNGKKWQLDTNIYEQGFSQDTFFNSVWTNKYCRGFMYGYPTTVKVNQ